LVEKLEFFSRIKSLSREIEIVMKVDSPIRHCLHSIIRLDHLITTEYHSTSYCKPRDTSKENKFPRRVFKNIPNRWRPQNLEAQIGFNLNGEAQRYRDRNLITNYS